MELQEYEALADTTTTSDIISAAPVSYPNDQRASVLENLRSHDWSSISMTINFWTEEQDNYDPAGGYDLGWLGYFIRKSMRLKTLSISEQNAESEAEISSDQIESFCECLSRNETIEELHLCNMGREENDHFHIRMMEPLFKNLKRLTVFEVYDCTFRPQEVSVFSLAKNMKTITLRSVIMGAEACAEVFGALTMLPHLESVDLDDIDAGPNISMELAGFLRLKPRKLLHLDLNHIGIDDEGFEALVPDLANCRLKELKISREPSISARGWQGFVVALENQHFSNMESLNLTGNIIGNEEVETWAPALLSSNLLKLTLSGNTAITHKGWQTLSALMENPDLNLEELRIAHTGFNDQDALLFADSLRNNHKLRVLDIGGFASNRTITSIGWAAFSLLLWGDSSSVNKTYLANHTLGSLGSEYGAPPTADEVRRPLYLNCHRNKKKVAVKKILERHHHLDMHQLFEWEFKTLPFVVSWFDKAVNYQMNAERIDDVKRRKLSAIYQYIRGMPTEYIDLRLKQQLKKIRSIKVNLHHELEVAQLRLRRKIEEAELCEKEIMKALSVRQPSLLGLNRATCQLGNEHD